MSRLDRLNAAEPSIAEQFDKRVLLIGRHDYWPGYTPDVIRAMPWDYWPRLALACDAITEQHREEQRAIDKARQRRGR